jgi:hypothetical protein
MNKITITLPPTVEVSDEYMYNYLAIFDKHTQIDKDGFSILPDTAEFNNDVKGLNDKHNLK